MKPIHALGAIPLILGTPALAHPEPGSAAHFELTHFLTAQDHVLTIGGAIILAGLLVGALVRPGRAAIARRRVTSPRTARDRLRF